MRQYGDTFATRFETIQNQVFRRILDAPCYIRELSTKFFFATINDHPANSIRVLPTEYHEDSKLRHKRPRIITFT